MGRVNKKQVLILLFMFIVGACSKDKASKSQKTVEATVKTHSTTLHFSGDIRPINEAVVMTPAEGLVTKIYFKYGQEVKKGDVLLTINSTSLQKNYNETLTAYLKAKDTLSVEQAKFIGSEKLWKAGLIAKNGFDADKSTLHSSEIAFMQAKKRLADLLGKSAYTDNDNVFDLSLSDVNKVKAALSKKYNTFSLKAPISGVILLPLKAESDKAVHVGSHLKENDVIALVGDMSGFMVNINIPEVDIDKLKVGMIAKVFGILFQDEKVQGTITELNGQATLQSINSGMPEFGATVVVKQLPLTLKKHLRIGMSANIDVLLESRTALVIPTATVHHSAHNNFVMLKTEKGCQKKVVRLGRPYESDVIVTSGLVSGDRVCL